MSGKIAGMVWELDIPHEHAWLLMSLADHAHHDGTSVKPGGALTAWKTGYSVRHCKRLIADMLGKRFDLLEVVEEGGGAVPAEYRIKVENFHRYAKQPFEKRRGRPRKSTKTHDAHDTGNRGKTHDAQDMGGEKPMTRDGKTHDTPRAHDDRTVIKETSEGATSDEDPSSDVASQRAANGGAAAIADDATSRGLLVLSQVKGFARDQGHVALKLAQYREEFPMADLERVVRDFAEHMEDHPRKKPSMTRLRNFFANAHERAEDRARKNRVAAHEAEAEEAQASPPAVVEALSSYERDGRTDLRAFAIVAQRWDFTRDEEPPFKVLARLGQTEEERGRNLERVRSVARKAVREACAS